MYEVLVKEFRNLESRYRIEDWEDGTYHLIYEIWDDGICLNDRFPPGWTEFDTGLHIYGDIKSAEQEGNRYLLQNSKHSELLFDHGKIVIWYWDEGEHDASKLPINNLVIYDKDDNEIWSIGAFLHRDEVCIGIRKITESSFNFITFSGMCYEMDVESLCEIRHFITK